MTVNEAPARGTSAPGTELPRPKARRRRLGSRTGYLYLAPFFLVFAAFSLYPWIDTAWVSLHDVRLTTYDQQTWVGLDNYTNLFTNSFFWNAFKNTITIGIISTVPQLCIALGLAHLLNYRLRGRTFFRVAMLMPFATSLAAATVIFSELFGTDYGIINWFLHTILHLPLIDWQNSKWPSQIAVSTIVTWRWVGYNALIYLAGMQSTRRCTKPHRSTAPRAGSSSATSRFPACGRRSSSPSWCRRSVRRSCSVSRCSTPRTVSRQVALLGSTRPSDC